MDTLLCTLVVLLVFFTVVSVLLGNVIGSARAKCNHNPNHPGLTENTPFGKRDIICPECKNPYCTYYYEYSVTPARFHTKTKVHLLNPFKPLVEDVTTMYPGQIQTKTKYQCLNCGYIFK
ncbi:MAG: hypothetical protein IKS56_09690 [Lachnospiraceae bacterium]|nr:hypothetical protein [Lachnospiraceae bacterium]MBR6384237.1 hypothetical protein [Lachnospiraceae bacterium]